MAARVAREKAITTRVAGNEEGDSEGSKGDGDIDKVAGGEEGDCEHHL
jgi:hypothetical protein